MQNRYVGDIGDYLKLGILRALSPKFRLGVAWWIYPDEAHNANGQHLGYLDQPTKWRHYDPDLFDRLGRIVASGQRHVLAYEIAGILPDAVFAGDVIPTNAPVAQRRQAREEWLEIVRSTLDEADMVFIDPDNGLEPDGFSHGSAKAGKSVLVAELRALARPGRCLIVYHHQTRRKGGHQAEIEHWAGRLRSSGFATVDALRASPYSPRVFFLLDAPPEVRQRAEKIAERWKDLITWHPEPLAADAVDSNSLAHHGDEPTETAPPIMKATHHSPASRSVSLPSKRTARGSTTIPGYVNRNGQEVLRPTGIPGTDHCQYVYVLRCLTCDHEYGANGSDIWLRRCPNHDRGAPGLSF